MMILLFSDEDDRLGGVDFEGDIALAIALNGDKIKLKIDSKKARISIHENQVIHSYKE